MRPYTRRGFRLRQASGPSPLRSMTPGRNPSINASAQPMRRSAASAPAGCLRSRETMCLPRLSKLYRPRLKKETSRVCRFGVLRSTRSTSAPRSASTIAANGAGPMPANSTMRTPLSGPISDSPNEPYSFGRVRALQRPRDQLFHDFIRAAEDPHDARIRVHACDRILVHVAGTAEQLQALVDDLAVLIRAPPL